MTPQFSRILLLFASVVLAEDCFDKDGTCQSDSLYCSGLYESGLCAGPSYIRCCVPDSAECTDEAQKNPTQAADEVLTLREQPPKIIICSPLLSSMTDQVKRLRDISCTAGYIDGRCLTKPGVCQLNSYYCSGSFSSGLCQGPGQRKCCVPSSSDSACTNKGGMCKVDSNQCVGSYQSGLCSGAANRKCCIPSKTTNAEALSTLSQNSIGWSSSGNCNEKNNPTCTSFDGLRAYTLSGIVNFKQLVGGTCDVTVTGGTETGHASMQFSHSHGYKVDIRLEQCVTSYIESTFTYSGQRSGDHADLYIDSDGNVYAKESNHWDILYY